MKICFALVLALCFFNIVLPVNAASVSSGDLSLITDSIGETADGIQVMEMTDYSDMLLGIQSSLDVLTSNQIVANEFLTYLAGFGLFVVIVLLCYFGYKFFKIFI